ncbi:hypothetical protein C8Q80DRAFT_1158354 [Daedaleopsis nitida]|nr:hypothetical protein C8Q80DRAFT_1158354 [Daedaleopsis nitida]
MIDHSLDFAPPNIFPNEETNRVQVPMMAAAAGTPSEPVVTPDATVTTHITSNPPPSMSTDLAQFIPGLYRILDLIYEQSSSGLVDKIIIEQDSLGRLVNSLCPHAYSSITKVDFTALDTVEVKPIGLYGSKQAIVDFLRSKSTVTEETATAMLHSTDNSVDGRKRPSLRPGLYVLQGENGLYVIYWPEDLTWDDNAPSSVRRNRITFMRYLKQITDQVVCLLSDEHAQAIVWRDDIGNSEDDDDREDEDDDRLFSFEVSKTHEQNEGAISRAGFQVTLNSSSIPADASLRPRLAAGETQQGVLTVSNVPAYRVEKSSSEQYTFHRLKETLQRGTICLSDQLSTDAIDILLDAGLKHSAKDAVGEYKERTKCVRKAAEDTKQRELDETIKRLETNEVAAVLQSVEEMMMAELLRKFPLLFQSSLARASNYSGLREPTDVPFLQTTHGPSYLDYLKDLTEMYPTIRPLLDQVKDHKELNQVSAARFKKLKEKMLALDFLLRENADLNEARREELVTSILKHGHDKQFSASAWNKAKGILTHLFGSEGSPSRVTDVPKAVFEENDGSFLSRLGHIADAWPVLAETATEIAEAAQRHFLEFVKKEAKALKTRIISIQRSQCIDRITRKNDGERNRALETLRVELLEKLRLDGPQVASARPVLTIQDLKAERQAWGSQNLYYRVAITTVTHTEPSLRYTLYPLQLTQEDRHRMQENLDHIPNPCIQQSFSSTFTLPADTTIRHFQLLPDSDRCLLVTRGRAGEGKVYVSTATNLRDAVSLGRRPIKELKRDKIGENFLLSYDEGKRILAVCGVSAVSTHESRLQLNTFVFDETYSNLQGMGSAVNLGSWYDSTVSIKYMVFVSGSEELLFIDDLARARIYSLMTQQFRPAMLQLPALPSAVYSTPDGSCFIAIHKSESQGVSARAYHWSSFGSSEGIELDVSGHAFALDDTVITSLMSRSNVYLLALDCAACTVSSVAFTITRKETEFAFKEKGGATPSHGRNQITKHNSIVDCHADVWKRFPVVPAVRREAIVSSALRQPRTLTFVSNLPHSPFASHFSSLIDEFERITRKPTGDELSSISILSIDPHTFSQNCPFITTSTFRAGEWLVELLCLIPIHIAITRDNRFIPLKDGVWSAELERSLLGADVAKIIDSISFGWYESLFQSYMAKKPVKVVSSMGEQSVGKSFALNHLVDTSFAGSAMRTTEGVWMSVTPTEEVLIVALDFEGVHSVERSAQEDTLLVLFNTAISNLVLFRNNFAMSRDITGLFQSFQASASVLDPEANPMLFQSTLAIIIKVIYAVESEIVKRALTEPFHLKFQQIVQAEQSMNFITRLHRNRLDIIPWPVIESKQFYTLFKTVKRRLDQQAITHSGGGVFLQTIKTLMAKLKANDWGSMSQNLAAHRAQLLLSLLPNALVFGASEVVPDFEPLTDFDTAMLIEMPDTRSCLFIENGPQGQPPSREDALRGLCSDWDGHLERFDSTETDWNQHLQDALNEIVDLRIEHVREWVTANTSKYPETHPDVQGLHRAFDALAVDVKTSVKLCGMHCVSCNLHCIRGRHHEGDHDCQTDHRCPRTCQYTEGVEHDQYEPCRLLAGHPGLHLCDVNAHLCGQACALSGKGGCQGACVKVCLPDEADFPPCSLAGVRLPDGQTFSCDLRCNVASHIPHNEHHCENRQCPVSCQLCRRLCAEHDHLHGLERDAVHLCGQEHSCKALCSAKGICQIETAPLSVEATFSGKHESFQYTKRLPCVVTIPVGELSHQGSHSHDLSEKCCHHCEERCPDCGYFCTLPLGHIQKDHETSHGSMSKTEWVVDGPDGTVLEVNGRKFGSSDEGAPMLCSMYCRSMGRHAHIDWCRADEARSCSGPEQEHIGTPMHPHPGRAKDWITHSLYWKRTDPYPQEDQANFAKCDRMCGGPEHNATAGVAAQPSFCTLPMLHPRQTLDQRPPGGMGYISNDGHSFMCRNPALLKQAFHVIFVIDRSGSMSIGDRRPLDNTPTSQLIRRSHNDRLGAVYSSLQAFWEARHHAVAAAGDAYSVILFDHTITTAISHDFQSAPIDLLNTVLRYRADGGTNYTAAIQSARTLLERHWSNERSPVIIFLSDGECAIADEVMQDLCRRSIALGKPLSFHSVAFGPSTGTLRRMAQIARDVESRAPPDPLNPHAGVPSSYTEALDTVRLAETFLGIADSLAKPRGALFHG